MSIWRTTGLLLPLLLMGACSDAEEPVVIEDPSKLTAELEAEARAIEERAAAAVREAEELANQELQALQEEARAAEADETTASEEADAAE